VQLVVGIAFDAVAVVEHAVVAGALATPVGDIREPLILPGADVVDVPVGVLTAHKAAVPAVPHGDGPSLRGAPHPGFAA
jgi:hypothetical protein